MKCKTPVILVGSVKKGNCCSCRHAMNDLIDYKSGEKHKTVKWLLCNHSRVNIPRQRLHRENRSFEEIAS